MRLLYLGWTHLPPASWPSVCLKSLKKHNESKRFVFSLPTNKPAVEKTFQPQHLLTVFRHYCRVKQNHSTLRIVANTIK